MVRRGSRHKVLVFGDDKIIIEMSGTKTQYTPSVQESIIKHAKDAVEQWKLGKPLIVGPDFEMVDMRVKADKEIMTKLDEIKTKLDRISKRMSGVS